MARNVGGPGRLALPGNVQPRQQMARAFGAPQARPAGQAGQKGVPHPDRARARPQAQAALLNRQRIQTSSMQGMGGSTIDVGRYFGEGAGQGGASGQGNVKCTDCGVGLIAGYDAMNNPDGLGVLCKTCWADMWVPHPHGNVAGLAGNTCTMGVRWAPQEWKAIQGLAMEAINQTGAALGRYPTANDYPRIKAALDPVLGANFKRSMKCTSCHTDIAFEPTSDDIPMPGINAPAQG